MIIWLSCSSIACITLMISNRAHRSCRQTLLKADFASLTKTRHPSHAIHLIGLPCIQKRPSQTVFSRRDLLRVLYLMNLMIEEHTCCSKHAAGMQADQSIMATYVCRSYISHLWLKSPTRRQGYLILELSQDKAFRRDTGDDVLLFESYPPELHRRWSQILDGLSFCLVTLSKVN